MAHASTTAIVRIDTIRVNEKKLRKLSQRKIEQYLVDFDRGDAFPPIDVDDNGSFYTIFDGRHRYQAQLLAGFTHIEVAIRS